MKKVLLLAALLAGFTAQARLQSGIMVELEGGMSKSHTEFKSEKSLADADENFGSYSVSYDFAPTDQQHIWSKFGPNFGGGVIWNCVMKGKVLGGVYVRGGYSDVKQFGFVQVNTELDGDMDESKHQFLFKSRGYLDAGVRLGYAVTEGMVLFGEVGYKGSADRFSWAQPVYTVSKEESADAENITGSTTENLTKNKWNSGVQLGFGGSMEWGQDSNVWVGFRCETAFFPKSTIKMAEVTQAVDYVAAADPNPEESNPVKGDLWLKTPSQQSKFVVTVGYNFPTCR